MSKNVDREAPISTASVESPDRRRFLGGIAAAAGATALGGMFPGAMRDAMAAIGKPETTQAKLGFIALTDAAPLFIAKEKGLFDKYGMTDVEVLKQSSWGTTRDNIVLGSAKGGIDGGHILTPMPYLISSGAVTPNNVPVPMGILARLNVNGQCISVSNEFKDLTVGVDTKDLSKALAGKKASGKAVNMAMTFPGGTHDLWIRYWMAAGGINPDTDVSTIVVPPAQMVANMKVGNMDAFCVCEPWNHQLIHQNIGYTAITTGELWAKHPEKAFALRADYIEANPNATRALLMAIMEAQMFCDEPGNKEEIAKICSERKYINAPYADIIDRMKGDFDYGTGKVVKNHPQMMLYWKDHASYPYRSHDLWFLTENIRWGYLPKSTDTKALVAKVNREDIWREAATALGVKDLPASTSRGKETFFDGKVFDPENPQAYLDSLTIKRMACPGNFKRNLFMTSHVEPAKPASAGGMALKAGLQRMLRAAPQYVLPPLIVLVFLLIIWQLLTSTPGASLPSPTKVVSDTWELIVEPFYNNGGTDVGMGWQLLASLERVAYGFAMAVVVGVSLGVLVGQSTWAMRGLDPIFQVLRTVPPLAWLPLSLAAFQDSQPSALFVIFITAIWPIIINTSVGVRNIPADYQNVARVVRLNGWEYFYQIMLPAAAPYIFTGLRIGIGLAWLAIVAAEMLIGGVGIGFFIWDAWNSSRISDIILALVYVGIVGFILDRLVAMIGRHITRGTSAG